MVDKMHEADEYQFTALEDMDSGKEGESLEADTDGFGEDKQSSNKKMLKNSLLVLGGLIIIFLGYRIIGSLFSSKPLAVNQEQPRQQPLLNLQPVTTTENIESSMITQKLSTLGNAQESMRTDIGNFNNQMTNVTYNVNDLSNKIDQLAKIVNLLSERLEQQTNSINTLNARQRRILEFQSSLAGSKSQPMYYIQALISGRAWLIASDGSTITVRDGSNIPGYGSVKVIDTKHGRIVTSTGRVIGFSQQDA